MTQGESQYLQCSIGLVLSPLICRCQMALTCTTHPYLNYQHLGKDLVEYTCCIQISYKVIQKPYIHFSIKVDLLRNIEQIFNKFPLIGTYRRIPCRLLPFLPYVNHNFMAKIYLRLNGPLFM